MLVGFASFLSEFFCKMANVEGNRPAAQRCGLADACPWDLFAGESAVRRRAYGRVADPPCGGGLLMDNAEAKLLGEYVAIHEVHAPPLVS